YRLPGTFRGFLTLGYPGLYMFGASYALIYFAEQHISSALTSVLFAAYPLMIAFLSIWVLSHEKLRRVGWLGLALGLLGIVVISYDSLQTSSDIFLGTVLALAGTLAAAWGLVIHKRKFSGENVFVATSVQMTVGGVPLILAALVFERWSDFVISPISIGSIVYLTLLGTVVAFVGYYWLLKRITAVRASLIAFITPLVAIFIGVIFFSESLTVLVAIGAVMILSGILLVSRK
ncbi:MAG: DMT family transporter, partial [candidate division Zixibacteria bacterium]|nr:DMT family transporter [candidate division Zixibacteria bacterium]